MKVWTRNSGVDEGCKMLMLAMKEYVSCDGQRQDGLFHGKVYSEIHSHMFGLNVKI